MGTLTICCPCLFGLESVLSGEIKRMGGQNIQTTDGKVTFEGDFSMVIRANIYLRTAERVLIVLGSFPARTFTELFDGTVKLPFEDFIGSMDAFPVKGWSAQFPAAQRSGLPVHCKEGGSQAAGGDVPQILV